MVKNLTGKAHSATSEAAFCGQVSPLFSHILHSEARHGWSTGRGTHPHACHDLECGNIKFTPRCYWMCVNHHRTFASMFRFQFGPVHSCLRHLQEETKHTTHKHTMPKHTMPEASPGGARTYYAGTYYSPTYRA